MSLSSCKTGSNEYGISYFTSGPQDSVISIIFIHGSACQATDFSYVIAELLEDEKSYQMISIDLPGSGKSSTVHHPHPNMSVFADAVLTVITDLRIDNVVLVGHSMGVRVILEAWEQSQRIGKPYVKGLVFLDGSHYGFRTSLFAFDPKNARSKALSTDEKAAAKAEAYKRMFSANTPAEFQASTLAHVASMDDKYYNAARQSFVDYDRNQMDEVLEKVGVSRIPLLNVQATDVDEQNQRRPLKAGDTTRWMRIVQGHVPEARLVVVEDSGHFPHVDQSKQVARILREFMQRLDCQHQ